MINSMSLDIKDVKANAIKAMVKRIERGDENVPVSTKIDSVRRARSLVADLVRTYMRAHGRRSVRPL